jgi:NADH-quinone oxidoreductase subunit E
MSGTGNNRLNYDWAAFLPKQLIPAANLLAPQLEVAAAISVASTEIATRMLGIWSSAMLGSFDAERSAPQPAANHAIFAGTPGTAGRGKSEARDDLKKISGVGPKLEQVLNSMGIRTYAQIAGWSADDIARVDGRLKLGGRILRDDWTGQANRFAGEVK